MNKKSMKNLPSQQKSTSQPDKRYGPVPDNESPESRMVLEARTEQFKGPLPHPDILQRYDEIVPGAAQKIISSFVTEGERRRERDDRQLSMCEDWARADVGLQKRGQIFGFILAFTGIAGGLIVTAFAPGLGAQVAGATVSGASLAAIVVAFLQRGRFNQSSVDSESNKTV